MVYNTGHNTRLIQNDTRVKHGRATICLKMNCRSDSNESFVMKNSNRFAANILFRDDLKTKY